MSENHYPWEKYYGSVPATLTYPDSTMTELVADAAKHYPTYTAFDFMGKSTDYQTMLEEIHLCAKSFCALGIKPGDKVTLCMPNVPQTVICFYALNLIGAIPNMIHPLSSEGEITFFLKDSESVAAVTLDQFYPKFESIRKEVDLPHLIITSIGDALGAVMKIGFALTKGRKIAPIPADADIVRWKSFLKLGEAYIGSYKHEGHADDVAVILYSGGTTGTTKGICLSNKNFNALALQTAAMSVTCKPGQSMLAVMPMFHGFGLGVCIHTMLVAGCRCILVPQFNAQSYAELLRKKRPNYIAGVPTLYEAILRNPDMEGVDLSCLMGVFSGGDSLSIELKKKFDQFLREHNAKIQIREGYGTTECVTASCLTPYDSFREGSIGIPFPDTLYKIVKPGTTEDVPYGTEGEICINGPTVMLGYANQPEETANTLKTHADGKIWLHTGDLGIMDPDGFVYYRQRIKRMIISSGYNIYPSNLENIIDAHPLVHMSCVIGVPDSYKMQKVKAFVVLKPGTKASEEVRESLFAHCRKNIAKYAMPYDIEIREQLPKTLVGKVAYRELEKEELAASGS
ncbi:MAG: AMP-binding protein [Clostridia bacterium]|nr:AMP-binding protein [Clostridia bacterium]